MTAALSTPYAAVWGTARDVRDSGRRIGSIHTHGAVCACVEQPLWPHTVALCARVDWRQLCDGPDTALAALLAHRAEAHP